MLYSVDMQQRKIGAVDEERSPAVADYRLCFLFYMLYNVNADCCFFYKEIPYSEKCCSLSDHV